MAGPPAAPERSPADLVPRASALLITQRLEKELIPLTITRKDAGPATKRRKRQREKVLPKQADNEAQESGTKTESKSLKDAKRRSRGGGKSSDYASFDPFVVIGINAVTRALEKDRLRLILVCWDQKLPSSLTNHLFPMVRLKNAKREKEHRVEILRLNLSSVDMGKVFDRPTALAIGFVRLDDEAINSLVKEATTSSEASEQKASDENGAQGQEQAKKKTQPCRQLSSSSLERLKSLYSFIVDLGQANEDDA